MTFNGWVQETEFEATCRELSLSPSQVACALNFGRDMIAEAEEALEAECNDNGFAGSCGCGRVSCGGTRQVNPSGELPF